METSAKFNLGGNFESMIKMAQKGFQSLRQHIQATKTKMDILEKRKYKINISASQKQLAKDIAMMEKIIKPLLKPVEMIISAKDHVSGAIKKMGSGISGLISKATSLKGILVGLAVGVGLTGIGGMAFDKTFGANSTFEQQNISMEHFLGGNKTKTQSMMGFLEKNAAATPFGMSDLMPAASRSVGISDGDVAKAQRLLILAEDMAALTPGKSVGDAMEALADARMGEFERMKEFNMKFSMEDLQSGGFGGFLQQAETKFKGGAKKLSESSAGLMSTIGDNIETSFRKMGENAFKMMKPQLQKIVSWFDGHQDVVRKWVDIGSKAISDITSKLIDFASWISTNIPKAGEKLSDIWEEIEPIAMPILNTVWDVLKSIGSWIGSNAPVWKSNLIDIWTAVKPYLIEFSTGIQSTWDIVRPIIESISSTGQSAFGTLRDAVKESMEFFRDHETAIRAVGTALTVLLLPAIARAIVQFGALTIATIAHTVASWAETIALKALYLWDTLITIAQWAWNASMLANPLTWVVIGIMALVGIIILLVKHWDWVKAKAVACWNTIMGWIKGAPDWLLAIISPILLIIKHWDKVKEAVLGFWDTIKSVFSNIGKWFKEHVIDPILSIVPDWLKKFFGGGKVSVDAKSEGSKDSASLSVDGSHANGLSFVPFDGYVAELHKGERVMTASENKENNNKKTISKGGNTYIFQISGVNKSVREILSEAAAIISEADGTMGEVVFD